MSRVARDDQTLKNKNRIRNPRWTILAVLILIGIASIAIRLLAHYRFDQTALLYVGIPYLISLAIVILHPPFNSKKWWHGYRDHVLIALIVFLGSSIVLFEGFVCVVMFMPIYFGITTVFFLFSWFSHSRAKQNGKTFVSVLPVLVLAFSLEGTSDSMSFNRDNEVTVAKIANLTPAEIMHNMSLPFGLQTDRDWLISIFPMPYQIDAGSLRSGDIHKIYTRYHRWFVTNTHEGEMHLQIVDVTPTRVTTRFIHDSSFFSSYLKVKGTEITLTEIEPNKTKIELQIDYRRNLDPAWYFSPLQQYGVAQMAEFLIDEVMIRE